MNAVLALCVLSSSPWAHSSEQAHIAALVRALAEQEHQLAMETTVPSLRALGARAVPFIRNVLDDKDYKIRAAAAKALAVLGPSSAAALEALVAALDDDYALVRIRVAHALGCIGACPPNVARGLHTLLTDDDEAVRAAAIAAFRQFPPPDAHIMEALDAALNDSHARVRAAAVGTLSKLRKDDHEFLATLLSVLRDSHSAVQCAALEAIALLGPRARGALPRITPLLSDRDERIRATACATIGALGKDAAPCESKLRDALRDAQPEVRAAAARALGLVATPQRDLVAVLKRMLQDRSPAVQSGALHALRAFAAEARTALPAVLKCMDHPTPDVRLCAVEALAAIAVGDTRVRKELRGALQDSHGRVRIAAAAALARAKPPEPNIIPTVIDALGDPDPSVRQRAVDLLLDSAVADKAAVEALRKVLKDPDPRVRLAAASTLWQAEHNAAEVVPVLVGVIGSFDTATSTYARGVLLVIAEDAPSYVVKYLSASTLKGATEERRRALELLSTLGSRAKEALPTLYGITNDTADPLRADALGAAWRLERAIPPLLPAVRELLKSGTPAERATAQGIATEMVAVDYTAILPTLLAGLQRENTEFDRIIAALLNDSMEQLGDSDAQLNDLLQDVLTSIGRGTLTHLQRATYTARIHSLAGAPAKALRVLEGELQTPEATKTLDTDIATLRQQLLPDMATFTSIDAALEEPDVLVPEGATWHFFRGTRQPTSDMSWTTIAFSSSKWQAGRSGFGYGDNDDATVLEDMRGQYTTLYIRHGFALPDPSAYTGYTLSILADDGVVAFVNGIEVGRSLAGAPGTPHGHDAVAAATAEEPLTPVSFEIPAAQFRQGRNVLALQGLNHTIDSSDFSLIPVLYAKRSCTFEQERARFASTIATLRASPLPGGELRAMYMEARILQRAGLSSNASLKFARILAADKSHTPPFLRAIDLMVADNCLREADALLRLALDQVTSPSDALWERWAMMAARDHKADPHAMLRGMPTGKAGRAELRGDDIRWALQSLATDGALRLNCGGPECLTSDGTLWSMDRFYRSGATARAQLDGDPGRTDVIGETTRDILYVTERWFPDEFRNPKAYDIPVPNGPYRVILHFAEVFHRQSMARVFDVLIETSPVLREYEPIVRGFATADTHECPVTVADGFLSITFVSWKDNPKISAIEVIPVGTARSND